MLINNKRSYDYTRRRLFGPVGRDMITYFMFDHSAATTSVKYTPSDNARRRVPEVEKETGLEYKEIVHSHPAQMDYLSYGDEVAATNALEANSHLSKIYLPVVSKATAQAIKQHELSLSSAKLSVYTAHRSGPTGGKSVKIAPASVRVLGLRTDLETVLRIVVASRPSPSAVIQLSPPKVLEIQNCIAVSYSFKIDAWDVIVIANEGYPTGGPSRRTRT